MNSHAETVNRTAGLDTCLCDNRKIQDLVCVDVPKRWLLDHLLFSVKRIVEYSCGMYMGAAIGFLLGWSAGDVYVEHFEPVYFSDFSGLDEIIQWSLVPYEFAGIGKLIGALAGAILIMVINRKLLMQRIAYTYEKGVTEPKDIAKALGKSVQQVKRIIEGIAEVRKVRPHCQL